MEKLSKFRLREENNFELVRNEIIKRGNEYFEYQGIIKAVSIWRGVILSGFFLTMEYDGIKSFHGFNFTKGNQWDAVRLSRQYVEQEGIKYSGAVSRGTEILLRRIGFKKIGEDNGTIVVMEKTSKVTA